MDAELDGVVFFRGVGLTSTSILTSMAVIVITVKGNEPFGSLFPSSKSGKVKIVQVEGGIEMQTNNENICRFLCYRNFNIQALRNSGINIW